MLKLDIKKTEDGQNIGQAIEDFKKKHGIMFVLAFSGGADDSNPILTHIIKVNGIESENTSFDIKKVIENAKFDFIRNIIEDILRPLRGYQIAIQCGGTKWGVPAIAANVAKELGFKTIGVFPLTGQKYALPENVLDLGICVHPMIGNSRWGDETPVFCKTLDSVVVIGGGAGTMVEIAHLLKMNESSRGKIRHILPVSGTGGTADDISYFPGKPGTMVECIPSKPLFKGEEILEHLRTETNIDDTFMG